MRRAKQAVGDLPRPPPGPEWPDATRRSNDRRMDAGKLQQAILEIAFDTDEPDSFVRRSVELLQEVFAEAAVCCDPCRRKARRFMVHHALEGRRRAPSRLQRGIPRCRGFHHRQGHLRVRYAPGYTLSEPQHNGSGAGLAGAAARSPCWQRPAQTWVRCRCTFSNAKPIARYRRLLREHAAPLLAACLSARPPAHRRRAARQVRLAGRDHSRRRLPAHRHPAGRHPLHLHQRRRARVLRRRARGDHQEPGCPFPHLQRGVQGLVQAAAHCRLEGPHDVGRGSIDRHAGGSAQVHACDRQAGAPERRLGSVDRRHPRCDPHQGGGGRRRRDRGAHPRCHRGELVARLPALRCGRPAGHPQLALSRSLPEPARRRAAGRALRGRGPHRARQRRLSAARRGAHAGLRGSARATQAAATARTSVRSAPIAGSRSTSTAPATAAPWCSTPISAS